MSMMEVEDEDDWVQIPNDGVPFSHIGPPVQATPRFEFQFNLEIGNYRYRYATPRHVQYSTPNNLRAPKVPPPKLKESAHVVKQDNSPFFLLPHEIRFRIYEFLLRLPWTSELGVVMTKEPTHPKLPTVLTILETCRRALYEAEHIFYSVNQLSTSDMKSLMKLNFPRKSAMQTLTVPISSAAMALQTLEATQGLSSLRSLRLVRRISIKYLDISSWNLLAPQLVAQGEKLVHLQYFEIFTPEAPDLNPADILRKQKLDSIDERIRQAVLDKTV